ncbi:MAG: hypothetical protein U0X73_12435 [Thermoanaerobaculia bacterium]
MFRARHLSSLALSLWALAVPLVAPPARADCVVANFSPAAVATFSDAASGDEPPLRSIAGPATDLAGALFVAADTAHGEIFAASCCADASTTGVTVHEIDGLANMVPLRRIAANATTTLVHPSGVAVDPVHGELFVANQSGGSSGGTIAVFARTADGDALPLRTITGGANGLALPVGVFVDLLHDELWVADYPPSPAILVFARGASGAATPLRTLAGAATAFANPAGVFVDTVHDEVFVADAAAPGAIHVFARLADGDVAPARTLAGSATSLDVPIGVAVTRDGELVVANLGGAELLVFARTASGDVAPARRVSGAATGLSAPYGLASTRAVGGAAALAARWDLFGDDFESADLSAWSAASP